MNKKYLIIIGLLALMGFGFYRYFNTSKLGATVPNTPAQFETSLAIPQATTDTSMTLASASLGNGRSLSGYYCFAVDSNTSLSEYECGTASTTSPTLITGITRGVDPQYGTSSIASLVRSHRVGADVRVTDFPSIQQYANIFNGTQGITNPILYSGVATSTLQTNNNYLASVGYVNSVAISGAANASLTQNGLVQAASALQTAAGTATGTTGALLFPQNDFFSSSSAATTIIPVTNTSGKLSSEFIDQTAAYTWTGLQIFNSATTTLNATTSIAGNAGNKFFINGVPYVWPSAQGGATTTLVNDGNGNLSWQPQISFNKSTTTLITGTFASTTSSTVLTILNFTLSSAQRVMLTGVFPQLSNGGNDNGCELFVFIDNVSTASVARMHQLIATTVPAWGPANFTYVTNQLSAATHTIDIRGSAITAGTCSVSLTQFSAFNVGN